MASFEKTNGADGVVAHAGGKSPGVSREVNSAPATTVRGSGFSPLLKKAFSVAVGMVGLAVIGLVSESPKGHHVDFSSLTPALGDVWLAGASIDTPAVDTHPVGTALAASSVFAGTMPVAEPSAEVRPEPTAPTSGITKDGKVILNLATPSELTRLPGIGQKRAEKIVELRESLGRFKKLTDLLRIKGIGPKSLRKMLPHLVLDPPGENQGGGSNG